MPTLNQPATDGEPTRHRDETLNDVTVWVNGDEVPVVDFSYTITVTDGEDQPAGMLEAHGGASHIRHAFEGDVDLYIDLPSESLHVTGATITSYHRGTVDEDDGRTPLTRTAVWWEGDDVEFVTDDEVPTHRFLPDPDTE